MSNGSEASGEHEKVVPVASEREGSAGGTF